MLDQLNHQVKGSGYINRYKVKASLSPNLAEAVSVSTGLTFMECDSFIKVTFEEVLNVLLKYGKCETEIGYFNLRYNTTHTSVTFHLKPKYTELINKTTEESKREIILK